MTYTAQNPEQFLGQVVGDGHCVAFVRAAAHAPETAQWSEGPKVKGTDLLTGTAIATFQNGKYQNRTNGDSHAAIFISKEPDGIWVYDQWKNQPVHKRKIRYKTGEGTPNNDGDAFSIIN